MPAITGGTRTRRATAVAFMPNGSAVRAPAPQPTGLLSLVLPLPPSINHHYATVQGRRVLSSEGRRFKTLVGQEVLCALAKRRTGPPSHAIPASVPLGLDLHFYFVSEIRRDIDGGLKITQDAVCEALGINDNRIVEVTLRKEKDVTSPRMKLSLRVCSPSSP
jgi:crossover junction endodeoxyribonuclease RusA